MLQFDHFTVNRINSKLSAKRILHPKKKNPRKKIGDFHCLCAGEDLNLHVLRHTHLKRACLPIPAPAQAGRIIIGLLFLSSTEITGDMSWSES